MTPTKKKIPPMAMTAIQIGQVMPPHFWPPAQSLLSLQICWSAYMPLDGFSFF